MMIAPHKVFVKISAIRITENLLSNGKRLVLSK